MLENTCKATFVFFFLMDEKLQQKIQMYKICTKYSFRSLKTWGNEILTE